ncbi:unnamed protein product [Blumeria hordei]|uniref:RNA-binding domain-containing protein n=2 Tax=Blumeria hordei TaxID=2867405 RepID=A0A383URG9_BLUHO|nr:exosome complex subunit Csl4 [Blumeria hordei DH14]SZF02386.1 unnamed protein product [Blumeria hordei]
MESIAVPGQFLGNTSAFQGGPGTHICDSKLYASILGPISRTSPLSSGPTKRLTKITSSSSAALPILSIDRCISSANISNSNKTAKINDKVLPDVGNTVLCRVTRITTKQATVAILVVGETVMHGEWQGLIRVQDVRATEKDKVKIVESFRPGDIVRAIVISLGDQSNYYLSTASNNLGVIMAKSEAGNAMYPVSWKEYRDPETNLSESRKVAKPL